MCVVNIKIKVLFISPQKAMYYDGKGQVFKIGHCLISNFKECSIFKEYAENRSIDKNGEAFLVGGGGVLKGSLFD